MAVMASKLCQKKTNTNNADNDVALEKHKIAFFFELVSS